MDTTKITEEINQDRRRFFGTAAMTIAATQFGMIGSAAAQRMEAKMPAIKPGTNTSFGPLKQINAGVLNVGYAEAGPANGPVVVLLHGWPYDIYSFVDVAPLLASAGYRVIVPYLRGYGTTRFLSNDRSATVSRRRSPSISRTFWTLSRSRSRSSPASIGERGLPNIFAALWPERSKAMVSVSGYLIGNSGSRQAAVAAEGRAPMVVPILFRHRPRPCRLRKIPERVFEADLADRFAKVGIRRRYLQSQCGGLRQSGSRRHRHPQLPLAARTWPRAKQSTPSSKSGSPRARSSPCRPSRWKVMPMVRLTWTPAAYAKKFSGPYEHRNITGGIGHNLPQEAPQAFAQAVVDVAEA